MNTSSSGFFKWWLPPSGGGVPTYDSLVFRTLDLGISIPAGLVERDGAKLAYLSNGLHLLGGWNPFEFAATGDSTNEHWFNATPDNPSTWVQLADAPWDGCHVFGCDVVGDTIYKYANDPQHQGATAYKYTIAGGWELITADMGVVWGDRYFCAYRYNPYDGYFYAAGGCDGVSGPITYHYDILRCTALFTDWEIVGTLPNTENYTGPCLEFINGQGIFWGGGTYLSDSLNTKVYSITNGGATVTEIATLPVAMRGTFTDSVKFDNKLFHVNGYKNTGGNQIGWYYSEDSGLTWNQLYDNSKETHASGLTTDGETIYRLTGSFDNFYYKLDRVALNTNVIPSGAEAIYSVRNDSSFVGDYAMQVQRSSDNATLDIGFVGEDIDENAMTTFMGAGDLYVSIWYDRSGNGNHASNVLGSRPRIGSSGVLDKINGKVAVYHTTGTQRLLFDSSIDLGQTHNVYGVIYVTANEKEFIGGGGNTYMIYRDATSTYSNMSTGAGTNTGGAYALNSQFLLTDFRNGRIYQRYYDGQVSIKSFDLPTSPDFVITNLSGEGVALYNFNGYMQEVIIYGSDKLDYKKVIETKINNYFSIY